MKDIEKVSSGKVKYEYRIPSFVFVKLRSNFALVFLAILRSYPHIEKCVGIPIYYTTHKYFDKLLKTQPF